MEKDKDKDKTYAFDVEEMAREIQDACKSNKELEEFLLELDKLVEQTKDTHFH